MNEVTLTDRRRLRSSAHLSDVELVDAHLRAAEHQLAEARETLIASRRRVVELEEALAHWVEFAHLARSAPARIS